MWHAVTFLLLPLLLLIAGPARHAEAQYFTEGGGVGAAKPPQNGADNADSLANIVDELRALANFNKQQQEYEEQQQQFYNPQQFGFEGFEPQQPQYYENADASNSDELLNLGSAADIQALFNQQQQQVVPELGAAEKKTGENGQPEQQPADEETPNHKEAPVDQKKRGQFEFVEFVEPHASKALKNVEYMDKRAPVSEISGHRGSMFVNYGSSNVLFIVAVTVCSVVVVAGVVGGAYHINNIRKQRNEAFDDFTRYSPAGPGRDMLRKGRGAAGSPITDYSGGDNELAKAAHLHHYEQTKQKIIGSDTGVANDGDSDKSDDEADDLEQHNFSIYECPGLAMSGDLEVKNPNFEQQHP